MAVSFALAKFAEVGEVFGAGGFTFGPDKVDFGGDPHGDVREYRGHAVVNDFRRWL